MHLTFWTCIITLATGAQCLWLKYDRSELNYDMRYEVDLDTDGRFRLGWDYDVTTENVTFRLEVNVSGRGSLIGFGFSDYGDPENADLMVFWADYHGNHHFLDTHTDSRGVLHMDSKQDYVLNAAQLIWNHVTLVFSRDIDTCDNNDYVIDRGTTHLVFFVAPAPEHGIVSGMNVSKLEHGLQRVQLLKSQLPDPGFPDDTWSFVMHVDNVVIPNVETTYWCKVKKLPVLMKKHHVIQFDGAMSEASRGIVHHLEVFHCEVPPGVKIRDHDAPCHSMAERPEGLESCRKVIGAWAMGAKGLTYPIEAGYPLGGEGFSRYIMMEVHYNNPTFKQGIVDSSGIRFFVTPNLREYDAGIMELGLEYTDKMALPPGQDIWKLTGYCIPECTHVSLPPGGIKFFASQLHTHQTGKRVYTKHYRAGAELEDLNRDDHYSPHYQEIRKLHRQVTVLPGDALVTTCEDTTKSKSNITLGGFSISDEMCLNYAHYYPKVDLEVCKSSVTTSSLYGFFNFLHKYQDQPTSPSMGISDNYKSIQWSLMNTKLLENFYEKAPLSMQCNKSDGSRFPGVWEDMPVPKVTFPLPPTNRPCLQ